MSERFHSIQVRAEDAADVALAIARRFRALGWKVVRDPKGRGTPTQGGDPDGLRRFLISSSDRGWVTILPSGVTESGPDSLVAFLARELDALALWVERRRDGAADEILSYEVYWKNKRIDRQDLPQATSGRAPSSYPTLIDADLGSLSLFMTGGLKHPKLTVAELPRFYPKYAGEKAYLGRFKKLVTAADYPLLWGDYGMVFDVAAPEAERLETWGHLGFQREDGRSAAARLTHGDPAARRSAVEALASCALEEARPGLQAALADDDAEVRLAAATVLVTRPDRALAQDLGDRMADEDTRVRIAAAKALRDLAAPETAEALVEVAADPDVELRRAAVAALSNIPLPAARAALLTAARKDKDPEVRRWAAEGLARAPFAEVTTELIKLLRDAVPGVRAAAVRAAVAAPERPAKLPAKLVDELRRIATGDKDEPTRAEAVRAIRALLPDDKEARELATRLLAATARSGDLKELAIRLPREAVFTDRDKRIVAALIKRLEAEPSADVIAALGNQAGIPGENPRLLESLKSVMPRLWSKEEPTAAGAKPVDLPAAAAARGALLYAFSRIGDPSIFGLFLKVLELERGRKVSDDPAAALADEASRLSTCFAAIEALLEQVSTLKPDLMNKLRERLVAWLGPGATEVDAAQATMRRVALYAFAAPGPMPATAKAEPGEANPEARARGTTVAKPLPVAAPPVLPNKEILPFVRTLFHDVRWPEAAQVLARQLGTKAVPPLLSALKKSIDKEVRLAKKGGYSKRDAERVLAHRRGIVLALRELRDNTSVPVLARLLALESLRAGKIERKLESSLLSVTINTLQTITGFKFGAEPQRWQEVASGKVPAASAPGAKATTPKPTPAAHARSGSGAVKAGAAKAANGAATKGSSSAVAAKAGAKAIPGASSSAKGSAAKPAVRAKAPLRPISKSKIAARPPMVAKKRPVSAKGKPVKAKLTRKPAKSTGARRLNHPKRMAARAARRR